MQRRGQVRLRDDFRWQFKRCPRADEPLVFLQGVVALFGSREVQMERDRQGVRPRHIFLSVQADLCGLPVRSQGELVVGNQFLQRFVRLAELLPSGFLGQILAEQFPEFVAVDELGRADQPCEPSAERKDWMVAVVIAPEVITQHWSTCRSSAVKESRNGEPKHC